MPGDTEPKALKIVRQLDAAPESVFTALTEPSVMRTWMYEEQDTKYDVDLRVGGTWSITDRRDGTEYVATGRYLEVVPPSRLVYTYATPQFFPNSDTVAIDLVRKGNGCEQTFVQSGEDIASELQHLPPGEKSMSEVGWGQGFNSLSAALRRTDGSR